VEVAIEAASARPEDEAAAAEVAARLGLRRAQPGARGAILLVGVDRRELRVPGAPSPLRRAGGLGIVRVRRLQAGGGDLLARAAGIRAGDRVLDATAGLCADALVAAHVVGPAGRVLALEASAALAEVVGASLARPHVRDEAVRAAAARIELRAASYEELLPTLSDGSFELVVFDPMWERPEASSPDFASVRAVALHAPLTEAALVEACRVARRGVLVKDAYGAKLLMRLGLAPIPGLPRRAALRFGWRAATSATKSAPGLSTLPP